MNDNKNTQLFDQFAATYDEGHARAVKASGFTPDYFHEYKIKEVLACLKRRGYPLQGIKILNFGCGVGNSERFIKKYFSQAKIYSIDISSESIKAAQEKNKGEGVTFAAFDGTNIPFDIEFDIIFAAGVFHHIPRGEQKKVIGNIYKQLKSKGFLFIFELNPLNPATLWVAYQNDYKFDKNSRLLTPFYLSELLKPCGFADIKIRYTVFFPGPLSFMVPWEKWLFWVPLGAHYYFTGRK